MFSLSGMRRALHRFGLAAVVLAALALVPPVTASPADNRWVGLDSGRVGDFLWSVKAKRPDGPAGEGPRGAQHPCLMVGTTLELDPLTHLRSKYRMCLGAAERLQGVDPPLIASGVQKVGAGSVRATAVGMIFAPGVRSVHVTYSNGASAKIPLHQLTPDQARDAHLQRFRYTAFAVRGLWCAERLVSLDASGRPLWDSGADDYECDPESLVATAP
jgi:hypothetical protein